MSNSKDPLREAMLRLLEETQAPAIQMAKQREAKEEKREQR